MEVVYSKDCLLHDPPFEYSRGSVTSYGDSPARLLSIKAAVDSKPEQFRVIPPNDYSLAHILNVHHDDYIRFLCNIHQDWIEAGFSGENCISAETFAHSSVTVESSKIISRLSPRAQVGLYTFDMSTAYTSDTWRSAYVATQITLTAAHRLMTLSQNNVSSPAVYALCRPPGHHASCNVAGGYCYINNAAVAARFLQYYTLDEMDKMHKLLDFKASNLIMPDKVKLTGLHAKKKILLVDIDYHHGNGTQSIFYDDPSVLYISLHGYPGYPYFTGGSEEIGKDAGKGYNVNVPLDPVTTSDESYLETLAHVLDNAGNFDADAVICSMGLDTWHEEGSAGFKGITEIDTFTRIGRLFRTSAGCKGRPVLFVQEGGTVIEKLGELAMRVLDGFCFL
ncbi:hypothetical protein BJV82DRAFT_613039 [Fennellomyces sp. T-0311]|nr:hypothetical protein BJV82DRAFT_613039 [Fennellomyces sp. T-0311]